MLSEALKDFNKQFRDSASADILEKIDKSILELAEGKLFKTALKVGDKLPGFELSNAAGRMVGTEDLLSKGPLVINFYRGGW